MIDISSMRRTRTLPALAVFVAIAVLLPVVITAVMLWSFLGRSSALASIPVAVVNDDEPVTVGDGDTAKTIAAGRQLTANLTDPQSPGQYDLDWVLTDSQDAADGLADGSYYAVLTIPEAFSSAITSTSGGAPVQAEITVQSNDASSALSGTISEQVATAAADSLGAQASASYLDNLFVGFNTISQQMTTAAASASDLSSGADELASSTVSVDDGAQSLSSSMVSLEDGAGSVASGAADLATGAVAVADGASQTASGSSQVAVATAALASGASDVSAAGDGLAHSASAIAASTSLLADSCPEEAGRLYCARVRELALRTQAHDAAASGVSQAQSDVAQGAADTAAGAQSVSAAAADLAGGATTVADSAGSLQAGAADVSAGTQSAASGAAELASGTAALVGGSASVADGSQSLSGSLATGAASVPTYTDSERETLQTVVTEPVVVDAQRTHVTGIQAWPAALVAAAALWLGAIAASYLRRRLIAFHVAVTPRSVARATASAVWPVLVAAVVQAVAVWVTMTCFGLSATAGAAAALTLAASVTFTAIVIALRTLSPRFGVLAAVLAFAAQLVCAGGLLPIQTAPAVAQALNPVLPLTAFADALAGCIAGTSSGGALLASGGVLLCWALAAVAVTVAVERRRSMRGAGFASRTLTRTDLLAAPVRHALGAS